MDIRDGGSAFRSAATPGWGCWRRRLATPRARPGPRAAGAARAFRQAIQLAPTRRMTSFMAHHDAQARLWQRQGDAAAALRWIQAYGLSAEDEPSYLDEAAYLTLARALLAQNRADEAIRVLTRRRAAAEAAGRGGRLTASFV